MMKKGFTLAEVLITLAIIGVVATMVLPGVMTSTTEQQAKTGIKKAINVLTNLAKMNEAIDGFDYAATTSSGHSENDQSIFSIITRRGEIDWATMSSKLGSNYAGSTNTPGANASNYVIFFRDGSYVSFSNNVTGTLGGANVIDATDRLPVGVDVLYDTNGMKSPNILSNCSANTGLLADTSGGDSSNDVDCVDRSKRVIKDQFGLRLRGSSVQPNGAAARWAFNN